MVKPADLRRALPILRLAPMGALCLVLAAAPPAAALVLDFETLAPGTIVTSLGTSAFSVENAKAAKPDAGIVFDSACPAECSGGDFDLKTPGQGAGNDAPQNHVLIIAEDVRDEEPDDGLVDDPDDERAGGTIFIDFAQPSRVESVRVLDIDTNETTGFIELTLAAGGTTSQPLAALGNNSAQTVTFAGAPLATSMKVFFQGSGAIDDIVLLEEGPVCGDGVAQAGEECDGADDGACPGACLPDCTCPPATTSTVPGSTTTTVSTSTTTAPTTTLPVTTTTVPLTTTTMAVTTTSIVVTTTTAPVTTTTIPIKRDPAVIHFDTKKGKGADFFSVHGNFSIHTPVDFTSDPFTVALWNENGAIWRGTLVAGELRRKRGGKGRFVFRDRFAFEGGPGDADNFYRVGMRVRGRKDGTKACHFRVKAYGDFSAATEPVMTLQIAMGGNVAGTTQTWKRTKRGWILYLRNFSE